MARKPKSSKPGRQPPRLKALPKLPFSLRDRGAYINRPWVAVKMLGKEYIASLYYSFARNLVEVVAVGTHEIDLEWQGQKQFYLDGTHTGFGPTGLAKTHLQWLKDQALRGGATLDAIQHLSSVTKLTKKEQEEMAKAGTKSKTKPVGKGGKLGKKGGNPEALERARAAAAARNAANHAKKISIKVSKKDTQAEDFKLRGGRLAKLLWVIENKPKTVGDAVGNTVKDDKGDEHKIDMGALRGMEKRGHIAIG